MSGVSRKPARDRSMEFKGFFKNLNEEKLPDASSEKDLGNEYFKQKKYHEAIECYSRSIALSPTSVAFANRAMAYLKVKRFVEAENDCTEALNLDDRYVKAYSRRATARKELKKLKESLEDSEFAFSLEPNNPELRKQYSETKAMLEKETTKKAPGPLKSSVQGTKRAGNSEMVSNDVPGVYPVLSNHAKETTGSVVGRPLIVVKGEDSRSNEVETRERSPYGSLESAKKNDSVDRHKRDINASVQDLASRAASRVMATAAKTITAPKSAYEFEVSWRSLSGDCGKQAHLLKTIPPGTLPQIFKNALSAPMLIEIFKCTATFFKEDSELAVNILENLAKVPRFDMIVMCLSSVYHSEIHRIWEEIFASNDVRADQMETLTRLRSKYCYGGWQAHILGSNGWPNEM